MYHVAEPCSDSGAYVAEPKTKTKVDMDRVDKWLQEKDYQMKFTSEVIVVAVHPEEKVEVGLYPSGKILFKTTDKEMVDRLFEELAPMMEEYKVS
ncbi:MAG: hypothetical protein R6U17_08770 [Thermoplasmata archaeon]